MSNLAEMLGATVERHGDHTAVALDDIKLSYAAVDQAVGLLRAAGVEPGDRLGIMLPNLPYFPFVFFGAMRLGAVVVPMTPLLKEREVAFYLGDSGAGTIVAWHQFEEAATPGANDANAELILVEPGKFEERLGAAGPVTETAERDDDDPAEVEQR
jgi:long-chain acyl-CoA synthetase